MKLAPLDRELRRRGIEHVIVHTGQHYDEGMSGSFFSDLDIPSPHHNLGVGSGSHAQQTAAIMSRLEPVLEQTRPDILLVYGDVNSTIAAALVAAKMGILVGHVEAGLRSRDWSMPEEINRVVTDRLSDLLFTPSRDGDANLRAEGIPAERIHFVGNIMIDALVQVLPRARKLGAGSRHGLKAGSYIVVTLHRPSNVDHPGTLRELMTGLSSVGRERPVVFPVHPRTSARVRELAIATGDGVRLVDPLGYIEMLSLVADAGLVVTDSGGLQEETSFLGVPCLTLRPNTERPVTITQGTNRLVASTAEALQQAVKESFGQQPRPAGIELWDGKTAERIADVLLRNA
jgi:UDP-N-acetylglucosamine 2-epimerase (non-hydrolysing)